MPLLNHLFLPAALLAALPCLAQENALPSIQPGLAGVQTPAQLEMILRDATLHAPVMIEQEWNIAQNDASRWRGIATYLPEIRANYMMGGFHEIRKSIDDSEANRIGAQISLVASHPVYWWGAWEAQRNVGLLEEAIAKSEALIAYLEFCRQARSLYYLMIGQNAVVEGMATQLETQRDTLERSRLRFEQNRMTEDDFRAIQLSVLATELDLQEVELELRDNLADFREMTGAVNFSLEDLPENVTLPPVDLDAMQGALHSYREGGYLESAYSRNAHLRDETVDEELTINDARALPIFNVSTRVSQQPYENNRGTYELQTILFAGISGTWAIFDRQETRDNKRSLLARRRLIEAQQKITRDRIFNDARSQLRSMTFYMRQLQMLTERRDLVQRKLELVQTQLEAGTVDELQLRRQEAEVLIARGALLEAKAGIAAAYESFYNLIGRDQTVLTYRRQLDHMTPQ